MRTPWVPPPLPLPVVGAVRSAVLRRISLAGGAVLPQAFPLARVRRGRLLPSISAALASPRGALCSPLQPPSGYWSTCDWVLSVVVGSGSVSGMLFRAFPFWSLAAVFSRAAARAFLPVLGPRLSGDGWPLLPGREAFRRRSCRLRARRLPVLKAWQDVGEYRATFRKLPAE